MILENFVKWWESSKYVNAYGGGQAVIVKNVAMDAFAAGALAQDRELASTKPACGGPGVGHAGGQGCGDCRDADQIKVTVKGGFAVLEDKDLQAIANRIRSQFEGWRKGSNPPSAQDSCTRRIPGVSGHACASCTTPKTVILDTQTMQVDADGCAVLSDKDVDRIAKATVAHGYAVRAQAARERLMQQQRQFQEEQKARAMEEIAHGIKTSPGVGAWQKQIAKERAAVAIRESEAAISNVLGPNGVITIFKFEFIISALRNLVAAVKILKEQV